MCATRGGKASYRTQDKASALAKERAAEQGVAAETICRKGEMREELENAAREEGISLIVLGRPADAESMFQLAGLEAFAAGIESEAGVETRIV